MKLMWRRIGTALQAEANGRLQFGVIREHTGWKLYRYSQKLSGEVVFKSKEGVRTRQAGRNYANALWALSGGREVSKPR